MSGENGKPTPKAQALAALRDLMTEAGRPEGMRPLVIGALAQDAKQKLEAVQELVRARKPKAAKVTQL